MGARKTGKLPCGEGDDAQDAGVFDGAGERSLMQRAGTGFASFGNLGLWRQKFPQHLGIFKINSLDVYRTKMTLLFRCCWYDIIISHIFLKL